jgi:pimeloyl-ACP methyl ester carboxylesterase
MSNFQLDLADRKIVTGQYHFPIKTIGIPKHNPLIIAIHGGIYAADYFHIDENHSAGNIARALNAPMITIDRPGYRGTSPLEIPNQSTYIREQGKYIHSQIILAIWKAYAAQLGTSSIVLLGHSIGAAVAIITASL